MIQDQELMIILEPIFENYLKKKLIPIEFKNNNILAIKSNNSLSSQAYDRLHNK